MLLSVVIPAYNEAHTLETCLKAIVHALSGPAIPFEIVVVDDGSADGTGALVRALAKEDTRIRCVENTGRHGFGFAIQAGLSAYRGDAVVIVMADSSDDPEDIVAYYRILEAGYDCAFGSRFCKVARVVDYPLHKLFLNRLGNLFIAVLFSLRYKDITNAFKAYKRDVIDSVRPILSCHFNITVELPLKAIIRGFSYKVLPTHWYNRKEGMSKFKIKEMGSRYLFIILYLFLEKYLSRGDYKRR